MLIWVIFQNIMTPEANRINVWHSSYLGVLKGAESKSAVCRAQTISPQNWEFLNEKSKVDATDGLKWIDAYIFLTKYVRNLNKICFCRFSYEQSNAVYSFETKCGKKTTWLSYLVQNTWWIYWRNQTKPRKFGCIEEDHFHAFYSVHWQQWLQCIGSLCGFTECVPILSNLWNTLLLKVTVKYMRTNFNHIRYISTRQWWPSWISQIWGLIGHFWAVHTADLESAPFNTTNSLCDIMP